MARLYRYALGVHTILPPLNHPKLKVAKYNPCSRNTSPVRLGYKVFTKQKRYIGPDL